MRRTKPVDALKALYAAAEAGVRGTALDYFGARVHSLSQGMDGTVFDEVDNMVRADLEKTTTLKPDPIGYDEHPGTDGGDLPSNEPPIPHSAR